MKFLNIKKNKNGFALLFTIVVISILLSVTLGVTNVAFRELKFSTSSKDANNAFYAADTGVECVELFDKGTAAQAFPSPDQTVKVTCGNFSDTFINTSSPWTFNIIGLGGSGNSCASLIINKYPTASVPYTQIISVGYNNKTCDSNASNVITREINVTY